MKKGMLLLLVVSCADNTLPGPESATVTVACSEEGTTCGKPEDCCSGYCQILSVYVDNWRTCAPPLDDGLYCNADYECASKKCIEYRCGGVGICEGASCGSDADCCAGTYCYNETYAPWVCTLRGESGAWCTADSHCRSGHCKDFSCVP